MTNLWVCPRVFGAIVELAVAWSLIWFRLGGARGNVSRASSGSSTVVLLLADGALGLELTIECAARIFHAVLRRALVSHGVVNFAVFSAAAERATVIAAVAFFAAFHHSVATIEPGLEEARSLEIVHHHAHVVLRTR
jgi:hypothetical protein